MSSLIKSERGTLLDNDFKATEEYFEAADKLSNLAGSHEEFVDATLRTEQASTKCLMTRLALEKHRFRTQAHEQIKLFRVYPSGETRMPRLGVSLNPAAKERTS